MRVRRLLVTGWCMAVMAGCNGPTPATSSTEGDAKCDADALRALGEKLDGLSSWEVSQQVWPGIEGACGDAIPPPLAAYFRPFDPDASPRAALPSKEQLDALNDFKRKACPDFDAVMPKAVNLGGAERANTIFQECDFQRYGVVEAEDASADYVGGLLVFAFHQWMLDQGVEAEIARPISKGLFTQQALGLGAPDLPPDFRMPVADGPALHIFDGVTVSVERIEHGGLTLVNLEPGGMVPAADRSHTTITSLFDTLSIEAEKAMMIAEGDGERWDGALVLVLDARTPYATLADVVYTAERAGYSHIALASARPQFGLAGLPIRPGDLARHREGQKSGLYAMRGPKDAIPQMARNYDPDLVAHQKEVPFLTLELNAEGFTLAQPGLNDEVRDYPWDELAAVHVRASEVNEASAEASSVVISASDDVPMSRLVSVITAARGSSCANGGPGCLLTEVTLLREKAHLYRPSNWPPEVDEDVWGGLTGAEVGEAYGVGGLGLVGTGRGGGGTGEGSIGLGNTGLIGNSGGGGFGGDGKKTPRVRQAKAKVEGPLEPDLIRRIVRAHISEVRFCYTKGLTKDPELSGRVAISFTISGTGKVTASEVEESSLGDEGVSECIAGAAKKWKFPRPRGGGEVKVQYPFNLSPG